MRSIRFAKSLFGYMQAEGMFDWTAWMDAMDTFVDGAKSRLEVIQSHVGCS